jgi:glycosyltransferase involved in cell wall biosynthesis
MSHPLRLLIVVNHAGFFLSHRLPIARGAQESGYEVHIATPKSRHVPGIIEQGLLWHEIRLNRSGKNPFAEFRSFLTLLSVYRRLRPAIVHHVTIKPVLYGTVAARLAKVPVVINALAGLGHAFQTGGSASGRLLFGAACRVLLRHDRMRVIFQNMEDRSVFVENGWIRKEQAVLIKGSGVDLNLFRPVDRAGRGGLPLVVLASRMIRTKGVADFVAAAALVNRSTRRARFVLVGEPDPDNPASFSEAELQTWAASGSVEYWGRRHDMPEVLAGADLACLPTFYGEGVPKSLIEAAASGLPIVTSDLPGCRDIVRDGENGLLVPPRDPEALARAMETILADEQLRLRFGQAGRRRVESEFSLEHVVNETLGVYQEAASGD